MKHRILVVALALLTLCPVATQAQQQRKKVAVVLSGGGAKGMAHIGALKVLERAGIPVDIITGTSMGSLIGGLYSTGWNAQALDSLVRVQDWSFLLSDKDDYRTQDLNEREINSTYFYTMRLQADSGKMKFDKPGGVIKGKNLMKLFRRLTTPYTDSIDFNTLPIRFACVGTDIVTNTEYDYHSGVLSEAMRSSMSIPGVFAPMRKGNMLLVDGGLRNNYPADLAREMGADIIIGVTVQGPPKTADDLQGGAAVLSQIVDVNCKNKYDDNLAITDVAIRVNTKPYGAASFTPAAVDTLIRRGEEEAMRHWDEIVALKRRIGISDGFRPALLHPTAEQTKADTLDTQRNYGRPTSSRLQGSVGARFDTEELAALQVHGEYQRHDSPWKEEATLRLGKRIRATAAIIWQQRGRDRLSLEYTYRHNDINIYSDGSRDYNTTFNRHSAALTLMSLEVRNLSLDLSAQWDFYDYNSILISHKIDNLPAEKLSDEHFIGYHARLHYNSEDNWVFPTRGAKFQAEYAYVTSNFYKYKDNRGFSEVSGMWRMAMPLSRIFTLQPMVYGRMLFGSKIPYIRNNVVGGSWFGHYVDQQMPFAGVGWMEYTQKQFVALQLKAQAQLTTNNFVLLKAALAQRSDKLSGLFDRGPLCGFQAAYYYNTIAGPVGAALGYSTKTHRVNFYINIGFEF